MANFRTHLSVAAGASIAASVVVTQTLAISHTQGLLLFLLGTLAGLLPDIDSDHSIPARLLFTLLSIATALVVLLLFHTELPLLLLIVTSLLAALVVRLIILPLFAATTEHRGLFHSIPMALLLGMITMLAGQKLLHWHVDFAWLAAGFVSAGYILHLLLDEFCSVDFMGASIKSSFGSAMSLFSRKSWLSYLLLYALLAVGIPMLPIPASLSFTW